MCKPENFILTPSKMFLHISVEEIDFCAKKSANSFSVNIELCPESNTEELALGDTSHNELK